MSSGKAKTASTNGASKKGKSAAPPANGKASPAPTATTTATHDEAEHASGATHGTGRPDKSLYDAEQDKIKKEIDALQLKLNAVKDKIGLSGKGGAGNDRRNELRSELDSIRGQQSNSKQSRGKIIDQLKVLQDGVAKKVKDLNAARSRIPFKSVAEVDARIQQLEKQVESGTLKLVDEKRALQEISQTKRNRRTVEGFQAEQDGIEADRAAAEELRKQLDDPEAKAASERYDAIKAELDELKKEGDEAYANRSKLMDERTALQNQLDVFYTQKRDSAQRYREANDRYWAKVNEDRARRAEKQRQQRTEEEAAKKKDIADRIREEADAPAFQAQIEDCQTLIDHFSGKSTAPPALSTTPSERAGVVGVPKLEIRKVAAADEKLGTPLKKKGESDDAYFVGSPVKSKKGKKGGAPAAAATTATAAEPSKESSKESYNVSLSILSALLSLSIPGPTSSADVPRVVEDLKTKKAWFTANQTRVTAENKAKAEAEISRLLGKGAASAANGKIADSASAPASELTPPNGGAERPAEPAPTPAVTDDTPSVAVPSEEVVEKLESVGEE